MESQTDVATESQTPAEALLEVREAREAVAARASAPAWYHFGLGAVVGVLTASPAAPLPLQMALLAMSIAALGLLVHLYRERTGLDILRLCRGRTLWVKVGLLTVCIPIMLGAAAAARFGHQPLAALGLAAANFAIVSWGGYLWQVAYRSDLGLSSKG